VEPGVAGLVNLGLEQDLDAGSAKPCAGRGDVVDEKNRRLGQESSPSG
jgi:hypothetical protein